MAPPEDDLDFGQTIRGFAEGQQVFGRYILRRILGRGGMGIVWLAWDEKLEEEIALKFMPEMVRLDDAGIQDLKRETRKSLRLTHANIVRIRDFVEDGNSAAIAMEYVDGPTLSSLRIQQPGHVFTPEQLVPWLRQFAAALTYAHDHEKVVHRDLKPANLMLNSRNQLKVADFGISSSVTDSVSRMSMKAGSSGSPPYMSPQQVMGDPPQPSDDIYSLGATVYELLTGKPPFHSGSIFAQIKDKIPAPMSQKRAELGVTEGGEISDLWDAVVARCLAKDPAERPQNAQQMLDWLEGREEMPSLAGENAPPPEMPLPEEPPRVPGQPKRRIWGIVAGTLTLLAAVGGVWFLSLNGSSAPAGAVALAVGDERKLVFLNLDGEVVRTLSEPAEVTEIRDFHDGLATVQIGSGDESTDAVIDRSGKVIIAPQWDRVGEFHEGLAMVQTGDGGSARFGFIDKRGKIVVRPEWRRVFDFREGLAAVTQDGSTDEKWGFIDSTGNMVIPLQWGGSSWFSEGFSAFSTEAVFSGRHGFIDKSGQVAIEPTWGFAGKFREGLAAVSTKNLLDEDGKWGFIDHSGKPVVDPTWAGAHDFNEGMAGVATGNRSTRQWGFINSSGATIIPPTWANVGGFSEGLAAVQKEPFGKWGFIDKKGNLVIQPQWHETGRFKNGLVVVAEPKEEGGLTKGKSGLIDKTGAVKIEPKWSSLVLLP
jgi:hypothetical protein